MTKSESQMAFESMTVDLHDGEQRRRVEEAMREVGGVLAVRLVPGYERPVDEAHVLVELDRSPKHVVRDLQSLLMASFDLPTDHRVFSVVQLDEGTDMGGPTPRVALTETAVVTRGGSVEVEVEIADTDGGVTTGSAVGGPALTSRTRTAGQAALVAVSQLAGEGVEAHLEGVEVLDVFGAAVALSLVRVRRDGGESQLVSGSAPVRNDTVDAVVRSTLDAMNRVLALQRD